MFVKAFYVYESGRKVDRWVNLSMIRSVYPTDWYDSKLDKTFNNVLGIETDAEVAAYIDISKPIEMKDLHEFASDFVIQQTKPKRGRPSHNATGENAKY